VHSFLIEPGNSEQLQAALTQIIENKKEAEHRSARAYKRYHQKYSIQEFASNIANLITNQKEAGMIP